MVSDYKLVPTKRHPDGHWCLSWSFTGNATAAVREAMTFAERERIPVLVRELGVNGVLTKTHGIWDSHGKLRTGRGRRR